MTSTAFVYLALLHAVVEIKKKKKKKKKKKNDHITSWHQNSHGTGSSATEVYNPYWLPVTLLFCSVTT